MPESDKVKIYYLASGHISIPIFEKLRQSGIVSMVGVGSQEKASKQTGGPARSAKTPLVKYCESKGYEIDRYASVNTADFHSRLTSLGVEILVVASFGQILKPALLALPRFGCLNVHASLLPRFRGASPISAALLSGDAKTGVTFMEMEAGLDTGPVYRKSELDILPGDDSYSLELRLGELAADGIEQVIVDICRNGLVPAAQSEEGVSYAKRINKEDGLAKWDKPAVELANMVRAYSPWPSLRAKIPARNGNCKMVKITEAVAIESTDAGAHPGDILAYGREGILVACGTGALRIRRIVPEGRKEMSAADYLLGSPIPPEHPFMYDFSVGDQFCK